MQAIIENVPAIIWIILGYLISICGGRFVVGPVVNRLYDRIQFFGKKLFDEDDEKTARDAAKHHASKVGLLDSIIYTTALVVGGGVFVVVWFTIKTAPQIFGLKIGWAKAYTMKYTGRWNIPETFDIASMMTITSLIGNGLNLLFATLGWAVIELSGAGCLFPSV